MTKDIQHAVGRYLTLIGHEHICENFGHAVFEMDVASLSKSNMLHEFEVKISRSDFLADKNKRRQYGKTKFEMYANPLGIEWKCPNYFYYVCPAGLIKKDEIPRFAGLLYYHPSNDIEFVKNVMKIHRTPADRIKVLEKMLRMATQRKYLGCTMMTYKNKLIKNRQNKMLETISDAPELNSTPNN